MTGAGVGEAAGPHAAYIFRAWQEVFTSEGKAGEHDEYTSLQKICQGA